VNLNSSHTASLALRPFATLAEQQLNYSLVIDSVDGVDGRNASDTELLAGIGEQRCEFDASLSQVNCTLEDLTLGQLGELTSFTGSLLGRLGSDDGTSDEVFTLQFEAFQVVYDTAGYPSDYEASEDCTVSNVTFLQGCEASPCDVFNQIYTCLSLPCDNASSPIPYKYPDGEGSCLTNTVTDENGDTCTVAETDCNGVCNGTATVGQIESGEAVCCTGNVDCNGLCRGTAELDCANTCGGSLVSDCAGVCGGASVEDSCGTCDGSDALGLGCDTTTYAGNLQSGSPWPMYGRNVFHAGITPIQTNSSTDGVLGWTFTTDDTVSASPSISADGTVYIGDNSGELYGVDAATGELKYQTGYGAAVVTTPAIDEENNLYYGSDDRSFISLTSDFTLRWRRFTLNIIRSNPLLYNELVFFGSYDGFMYAIRKDFGVAKWFERTIGGKSITSSPVLSADGVYVYVLVSNQNLYWFATEDGTRGRYVFPVSDSLSLASPGIFVDGDILVPTEEGLLFKFNHANQSYSVLYNGTESISATPLATVDGKIFVGTQGGTMVAIDGYTGTVAWTYSAGSQILQQASLTNGGILYFTNLVGKVFALNSSTGDEIWQEKPDDLGMISSAAVGADGAVVVSGLSGKLYSYGGNFPTCNSSAGISTSPVSGLDATDFDNDIRCSICEAGLYSSASACAQCYPGFASALSGVSECSACAPGQVTEAFGMTECEDCAAGTYGSATAASSCIDCSRGEYQPATGATACIQCTKGSFARNTGSSACTNCTAGRFAATDGLSSCTNCDAGSFVGFAGATACSQCDIGTFSDAGASVCSACPPGTIADGRGASACALCPAGAISNDGVNCTDCAAGTSPEIEADGSAICQTCAKGSISSVGSANCTECPREEYTTDNIQVCINDRIFHRRHRRCCRRHHHHHHHHHLLTNWLDDLLSLFHDISLNAVQKVHLAELLRDQQLHRVNPVLPVQVVPLRDRAAGGDCGSGRAAGHAGVRVSPELRGDSRPRFAQSDQLRAVPVPAANHIGDYFGLRVSLLTDIRHGIPVLLAGPISSTAPAGGRVSGAVQTEGLAEERVSDGRLGPGLGRPAGADVLVVRHSGRLLARHTIASYQRHSRRRRS
jgi:outer membrane protein assembly factor BamB